MRRAEHDNRMTRRLDPTGVPLPLVNLLIYINSDAVLIPVQSIYHITGGRSKVERCEREDGQHGRGKTISTSRLYSLFSVSPPSRTVIWIFVYDFV